MILALIADCDWIIEVVAENLEIKRGLLAKVQKHRRPGTITTTNTSGLPIAEIVEGMEGGDDLRRHWFGTHFFNPPRYMRLLEVIATPDAADCGHHGGGRTLGINGWGRRWCASFDTPNFIANRIGTFSMGNAIRLMHGAGAYNRGGRRADGDAAGLAEDGDVSAWRPGGGGCAGACGFELFEAGGADQGRAAGCYAVAPFIAKMLENKWLGDKVGQGFYKKAGKDKEGRDLRHVLDWQTLDYGPSLRPKFPALEMAKPVEHTEDADQAVAAWGCGERQGGGFYWPLLTELFTYAANRLSSDGSEPAANIVAIDAAMKTGFNWELGPFEMMDAAGVRETTEKMRAAGLAGLEERGGSAGGGWGELVPG